VAAQSRCASSGENNKAARCDHVVRLAHEIWREEPSHRRSVIESLLLTAEPFERIAMRFDLPVEVIECYHEIFFHVRPYLDRGRDWIMGRVIGTSWWRGFAGLPLAALWKYMAYIGGPLVLDMTIAITTDGPLPAYIREWFARQPRSVEVRTRFKGTLLAKALTADCDEVWEQLVAAHAQVRRLDEQTTGTLDEAPSVSRVLDDFFLAILRCRKPRRKTQPRQGKTKTPSNSKTGTTMKPNEGVASFLDLVKSTQGGEHHGQ
jgi:hypothetical protein